MRDRALIFAGLLLFVGLFTYPLWHAAAAGTTAAGPDIKLPQNEKTCVAPLETMRAAHQQLLIEWRENAVRNNQLTYTAWDGKVYQVGLTTTCLHCHTNRAQFCERCHTYAGVTSTGGTPGPYCWQCHVDPGQLKGAQ